MLKHQRYCYHHRESATNFDETWHSCMRRVSPVHHVVADPPLSLPLQSIWGQVLDSYWFRGCVCCTTEDQCFVYSLHRLDSAFLCWLWGIHSFPCMQPWYKAPARGEQRRALAEVTDYSVPIGTVQELYRCGWEISLIKDRWNSNTGEQLFF